MCGRYDLDVKKITCQNIGEIFGVTDPAELQRVAVEAAQYNISPAQRVAVVRAGDGGRRSIALLRWGLVPFWAPDPSIGYKTINARAETVSIKSAFRDAFKKRRCLLPATGFYEWKAIDAKKRQPWRIQQKDAPLFAFAGLWDAWGAEPATRLETCTIVTTAANPWMAELHDRMPVIVPRDWFDRWLSKEPLKPEEFAELLARSASIEFTKIQAAPGKPAASSRGS
jgi:putative SOS response-associated peptidase YedK